MRLDKFLAHLGYGTRKDTKTLVRSGAVLVNGESIKDGGYIIDENNDEVVVYDTKLDYEEYLYIIMNKPSGVVSATFDSNCETVLDLLPDYASRGLFPVGRLDKDSTGLLLLTNDGQLAHQLLSPKNHVKKVYEVSLDQDVSQALIPAFSKGVVLEDGYHCKSAELVIIEPRKALVTVTEGKFHQVKRMFQAFNINVLTLKRIKFGSLSLPSSLKEGEYQKISKEMIY
ncbi:MAG: pseudouridine synthase [Bacilli bacterium]|nr:pseudouridine synthase [Bacilli bacterium]MDD4065782.1 pseudouridine synthase [Bacilli bacterium]